MSQSPLQPLLRVWETLVTKNTTVIIPAHKVVTFKPAAGFEEEVANI